MALALSARAVDNRRNLDFMRVYVRGACTMREGPDYLVIRESISRFYARRVARWLVMETAGYKPHRL